MLSKILLPFFLFMNIQAGFNKSEVLKQSPVIVQRRVSLGDEEQILKLDNFGTVINHQLVYQKALKEQWPCTPLRQQIKFQQPVYIDMVEEYSQKQFEAHFINGKFKGQIPRIIAFEQIEDGAAVLTSQGQLHIVSIKKELNGTLKVQIEYTEQLKELFFTDIFKKTNNQALLIYELSSHELMIILSNLHIVAKIKNYQVESVDQLESLIGLVKIEGLVRLAQCVCIAAGVGGLQCFEFDKLNGGFRLSTVSIDNSITANDIRAVKLDESNYEIYVLDPNQGVLVYFANVGQYGMTMEITQIAAIGNKNGITFDIYRNTLMLVTKINQNYFLHDYHIDLEDLTWIELNRWIFQSEIRDIDVSTDFAIVTGRSGHHIVYHSVSREFNQDVFNYVIDHKSESDLYLPNLQRIDFLAKNLTSQNFNQEDVHQPIAFGITRHKFFAIEWDFYPIQIVCRGNDRSLVEESPIKMKYHLNSTQCPNKNDKENDMQMCQTEFQMEVTFNRSIVNKGWLSILLFILGSVFGIIMLTIICVSFKFMTYKNKKQAIQSDLDNFASQGYIIDNQSQSSFKEKKLSQSKPDYIRAELDSNSKTPVPENQIEN